MTIMYDSSKRRHSMDLKIFQDSEASEEFLGTNNIQGGVFSNKRTERNESKIFGIAAVVNDTTSMQEASSKSKNIMILAGPMQTPFYISRHILQASEYFKILLSGRWEGNCSDEDPICVDCEEDIFRLIIRLMQYGSASALPESLTPNQLFRLHHEVNFFGITVPDLPPLHGSNPILNPCRLAQVTWLASSYKDVSCQCHIRFEARWLVNLYYCYVFCAQCRCTVTLPDDLLIKVLAIAEGAKGQFQSLPEAPVNKFRNGVLTCGSVTFNLFQIDNLDGWHCFSCHSSSFAVCLDPFHAFCTACHTAVTTKSGIPKSSALVGKLWLMAVLASRNKIDPSSKKLKDGPSSSNPEF